MVHTPLSIVKKKWLLYKKVLLLLLAFLCTSKLDKKGYLVSFNILQIKLWFLIIQHAIKHWKGIFVLYMSYRDKYWLDIRGLDEQELLDFFYLG